LQALSSFFFFQGKRSKSLTSGILRHPQTASGILSQLQQEQTSSGISSHPQSAPARANILRQDQTKWKEREGEQTGTERTDTEGAERVLLPPYFLHKIFK
jgi:hypothetical protein